MTSTHDPLDMDRAPAASPERIAHLLARREELVALVARRVGDHQLAEDLLQEAFVKALTRPMPADDEAATAWLLRVIKNAAIDQGRRLSTRQRALERLALDLDESDEVRVDACRCVLALADELKPEYREALRRIEVDGLAVKDFAEEQGLTAANAAARVMRARRALARELTEACGLCARHGCHDCACG